MSPRPPKSPSWPRTSECPSSLGDVLTSLRSSLPSPAPPRVQELDRLTVALVPQQGEAVLGWLGGFDHRRHYVVASAVGLSVPPRLHELSVALVQGPVLVEVTLSIRERDRARTQRQS